MYDPYYGYEYVDFNVPWSLKIDYSFRYNPVFNQKTRDFDPKVTQSMSLSGDFSLTEKWKFSFRSGYDFNMGKMSSTSLNISRDLHCWAMDFSWIPFGNLQSYSFRIYIRSSVFDGVEYKIQEQNRRYSGF